MQVTVSVRGGMVRQGLENLAGDLPRVGRRRMRTMADRVVRIMQVYPPEPSRRTKVEWHPVLGKIYTKTGRTGLLFRSWFIREQPKGYMIGNDAARRGRQYAKYVVGNAYGTGQAWMHVGRWKVFRDVLDAEVAKLPQEITKEIIMVARREGLRAS